MKKSVNEGLKTDVDRSKVVTIDETKGLYVIMSFTRRHIGMLTAAKAKYMTKKTPVNRSCFFIRAVWVFERTVCKD